MLLIIFFLFILLLTYFFGDKGIIEIMKTQKEIRALETSIQELEARKRSLTSKVKQLREDPLALEREAREKLWLMKKNEKVIVIVKDKREVRRE
jgi:cell division protein FtsB